VELFFQLVAGTDSAHRHDDRNFLTRSSYPHLSGVMSLYDASSLRNYTRALFSWIIRESRSSVTIYTPRVYALAEQVRRKTRPIESRSPSALC